jgi:hypothetical protein
MLCSVVRWSLWKLRNNSVLSMQELELFAITMVTSAIGAVVPPRDPCNNKEAHLLILTRGTDKTTLGDS